MKERKYWNLCSSVLCFLLVFIIFIFDLFAISIVVGNFSKELTLLSVIIWGTLILITSILLIFLIDSFQILIDSIKVFCILHRGK